MFEGGIYSCRGDGVPVGTPSTCCFTQELVKVRPEDPIKWMSEYLRDNNPNVNPEAAARAAKRRRLDEEARAAEAAKPAV